MSDEILRYSHEDLGRLARDKGIDVQVIFDWVSSFEDDRYLAQEACDAVNRGFNDARSSTS